MKSLEVVTNSLLVPLLSTTKTSPQLAQTLLPEWKLTTIQTLGFSYIYMLIYILAGLIIGL
ncbi:hypothetical protein A11A3_12615 [Alcanivorax hongdengensis A-11-3]|uniref:Uncharacterized protein n=1 Tax=Alcanivorax hongdengensis A-11-3 TaxID=1177179 RepID=L0W9K3_9GAMM|nr:hypothetical protein A11A3_12615 [Alcanivorax hongdengensis A-11-3]